MPHTIEDIDKLSREELKKLYDAIPPEVMAIINRKHKFLNDALPIAIMAKSSKNLGMILRLGEMSIAYCAEFKCSPMTFIQDLKIAERAFVSASIEAGDVSFGEDAYDIPEHLKEKNRKNREKIERGYHKKDNSRREDKPKAKTQAYTLGDAMKAQGILDKFKKDK